MYRKHNFDYCDQMTLFIDRWTPRNRLMQLLSMVCTSHGLQFLVLLCTTKQVLVWPLPIGYHVLYIYCEASRAPPLAPPATPPHCTR